MAQKCSPRYVWAAGEAGPRKAGANWLGLVQTFQAEWLSVLLSHLPAYGEWERAAVGIYALHKNTTPSITEIITGPD